MNQDKRNEHKEKLLSDLAKRIQEAEERKVTIEENHRKSLATVEDELDSLELQRDAIKALK